MNIRMFVIVYETLVNYKEYFTNVVTYYLNWMEIKLGFQGIHEIARRLYLHTRELELLLVTHGAPLASKLRCPDLKRPNKQRETRLIALL